MFGRRNLSSGQDDPVPEKPQTEEADGYAAKSASKPSMGMTMSNNRSSPPSMRPEIAPRRRPDLPGMPGMGPSPRHGEAPEPSANEGKRLLVGRDIFLTGEITACNKLVIEGRVEASLAESQSIDIAATGHFKGSAEAETAEVSGRFEGKLLVRKRLTIRATGRVTGEIRYGEIEIECGGVICGDIQTVDSGNPGAQAAAGSGASAADPAKPAALDRG
jgi:cytoskeletal protein CcmA (bactofilin family)